MQWLVCGLAVALAAAGCSSDGNSETSGSLNLNLELADGVTINEVSWEITGGDMEPMSGTIDTSAPGATASVEVFGLPPGDGYTVTLEATDETGTVSCKGDADFAVEVGVATDVMVFLNCKLPSRLGGVRVNGKFNICAELAKVVVSPLQTSVGNVIDLSAEGQDTEGDPIEYAWSATGGTVADPSAQVTTYTCEEEGDQAITIQVSDDGFDYCMAEWTVAVTCVSGGGTGGAGGAAGEGGGGGAAGEGGAGGEGGMAGEGGAGGTAGEGGTGGSVDPCEGVICENTECTTGACDPSTGLCVDTPVQDGTECADGTGTCEAGECIDNCADVQCEEVECQLSACNPFTGACESENAPDGTSCANGAGTCEGGQCITAAPTIAEGSGSSFWSANTNPPGGGTAPTTGGCQVFVTVLATDIFLDVDILLEATSDGSNNMATGWTITAANPLLGALGNAAQLGGLDIAAVVTNANGGPIASGLDPSAVGQNVGAFYLGPAGPLQISSPSDITQGSAALTPTVGAGGTVSVNWDGAFALDLTLGGMPLITVDESVCAFDEQGPDIDFAVN